jgi:hypothetical protein
MIPDWIEVICADDFCFGPNLCELIPGLQKEIDGFRDCRKLEHFEPVGQLKSSEEHFQH